MNLILSFRPTLVIIGSLLVAASTRAESLTFTSLKENEVIVINYASSGCFHHFERKYVMRGGARFGMEVYEPRAREKNALGDDPGREHFLVRTELNQAEREGLDAYLYYLRSPGDAWCTTVEAFILSYYRNDVKIGEETLRDASCGLTIGWADGKLVYDESRPPPGISSKLYKTIVTPQLLERRALEQSK
jgi:hypothetical protein